MTLIFNLSSTAQRILISDQSGRLYDLEVSTCQVTNQVDTDADIQDISYLPDGTLIGISAVGELWEINAVTGTTVIVHQFGRPIGGIFNSLTTDADGTVYTTGTAGELYAYNINSDIETFIGSLPAGATGDLSFFDNELYVAADFNKIYKVDLNNLAISDVIIISDPNQPINGIVTNVEICNIAQMYAISGGDQHVLSAVNLETKELVMSCVINFSGAGEMSDVEVLGGASVLEHRAAAVLMIDDVIVDNPVCCGELGNIDVLTSGGVGSLSYSVDNGPFLAGATIEGIAAGRHTLQAMDEEGCVVQVEFEIQPEEIISMGPLAFEFIDITPADCFGDNGRIRAAITGSGTQATGSGTIFFNNASFGNEIDISVDAGRYELSAIDGGMIRLDTLIIIESEGCDIYIPNVIRDNSVQGDNNRFIIFAEEGLNPTILVYQIFDRWGNKMYERFNLETTQFSEWWDGSCNGSPCEQDVYAYYVKVDLGRGNVVERTGTVTYLK